GSHLRQLDQEHARLRDARTHRPQGPARRRAIEVLELLASLARLGRRLQPGRPALDRRRRPVLLLRRKLSGGPGSTRRTGATTQETTQDMHAPGFCPRGFSFVLTRQMRKRGAASRVLW